MVGVSARCGLRPRQPAARRRAHPADGAVALPADLTPVRQPDIPAGGGDPRVCVRREPGRIVKARANAQARAHKSRLIDRDRVWKYKRAALEAVYRVQRSAGRDLAYQAYRERQGRNLDDFATSCALAEKHGGDWHEWPEELRHPESPAVARFAADNAAAVDFHRWLQWQLDDQLTAAQATSVASGMGLGIMHDLAVGSTRTGPMHGPCRTCWRWASPQARRRTSSIS